MIWNISHLNHSTYFPIQKSYSKYIHTQNACSCKKLKSDPIPEIIQSTQVNISRQTDQPSVQLSYSLTHNKVLFLNPELTQSTRAKFSRQTDRLSVQLSYSLTQNKVLFLEGRKQADRQCCWGHSLWEWCPFLWALRRHKVWRVFFLVAGKGRRRRWGPFLLFHCVEGHLELRLWI